MPVPGLTLSPGAAGALVLLLAVVVVALISLVIAINGRDRAAEAAGRFEIDPGEMPRAARLALSLVVSVVLFAAMLLLLYGDTRAEASGFLTVAVLILVGIGTYIFIVNTLSRTARRNGILDGRHPFGLPEGTVRAILTISFIVLVGVIGAYLVAAQNGRRMFAEPPRAVQSFDVAAPAGATDAAAAEAARTAAKGQADALRTALAAAYGERALVLVRAEGTPATAFVVEVAEQLDYRMSDEISKQMLTIISTILAAMIGFYFAERGQRSGDTEEARIAVARGRLGWAVQDLGNAIERLAAELGAFRQSPKAAADPGKAKLAELEKLLAEALDARRKALEVLPADVPADLKTLNELIGTLTALRPRIDRAVAEARPVLAP